MNLDDRRRTERRFATHQVYVALHSAKDLYHKKTLRSVITEMMYAEREAWRAVGITRAALSRYAETGHRKTRGLERAHLTDRKTMIDHLFERHQPLSLDALFDYWTKTDRVVIALRSENRADDLGDWVPFENPRAEYFTRLGIGFSYRQAIEGELTRKLARETG